MQGCDVKGFPAVCAVPLSRLSLNSFTIFISGSLAYLDDSICAAASCMMTHWGRVADQLYGLAAELLGMAHKKSSATLRLGGHEPDARLMAVSGQACILLPLSRACAETRSFQSPRP